MTRTAFHRLPRTYPPASPEQKVALAAPPQRPAASQGSNWIVLMLPLLSSISMAAYMITFGKPWMIMLGISFVIVSVATTVYLRWQSRNNTVRQRTRQRELYLDYLSETRSTARRSAEVQRAVGAFLHPSPHRLWALACGRRRIWERRPSDADFLQLRLGLGRGTPSFALQSSLRNDPMAEYDQTAKRASERLLRDYTTVGLQPAWIDLKKTGVVSVLGTPEKARSTVRAMLLQTAVLHAPDDVQIAVLTPPDNQEAWTWAKWLPHTHDPSGAARPAGVVPLVTEHVDWLADVLETWVEGARADRAQRASVLTSLRDRTPQRHLVVVLDGYRPDAGWARTTLVHDLMAEADGSGSIHVLCLVDQESQEPSRVDVRIRLHAGGGIDLQSRDPELHNTVEDAVADTADLELSMQVARQLAPLRLSDEKEQVLSRTVSLPAMLAVDDVADFDPSALWRAPEDERMLRVPIGVTGSGQDLVLDLKESAQGGVGPHGLIVGATGSGKSELLRTLVSGLTMTHSPEHLSFVLVDFKGGATFAGVTDLPHVAGLITNLADDLALVDRMRAALIGEQQRRQKMLRDAGNVDSVREYQRLHAQGATGPDGRPLEAMPHLVIVVDEFGELLTQRSDFIDLFVQIGRVGRSLGMHLLLATQRLDEGRLRGLESHLSYRICLRTFSAAESKAVIGTSDAYKLPAIPGSAYLKVDESVYERFRVAYFSGAYENPDPNRPAEERLVEPVPFGLRTGEDARAAREEPEPATAATPLPVTGARTEMQVAVERLKDFGRAAHQVWLPPLPPCIELDSLLGPGVEDGERGFHAAKWDNHGNLSVPIGVVDLPLAQEQRALSLNLGGAHGHTAVVASPQTGKSLALRTILVSAMLTHTPEEIQFSCVDFGGGGLGLMEEAPHVMGVATRHDIARVRRALNVVHQLVVEREQYFAAHSVDSVTEFRRRRDSGELPQGTHAADVVLVIDNWAGLRAEVEEADILVQDISSRGLGVGVHLLLTANRWAEIRTSLRDNIAGRLELRLNDAGDSEVSRKDARLLRNAPAGRGMVAPGHLLHIALPRIDGVSATDGLAAAQRDVVTRLATGWHRQCAPALRTLPDLLTAADLAQAVAEGEAAIPGRVSAATAVPIGLRESDLAPVRLDLSTGDPHFLVLGDAGSGKTSFLRTWLRGLAARQTPDEARFLIVDYRRGLLEAVPDDYIAAQAATADHTSGYLDQIVERLQRRMPPADVTAQQLHERAWWSGPDLYVVVDDYDLVAGPAGRNPLAALHPFLTHATDIGLHIVAARRGSGAARAFMSDPLIGTLRDFGTSGLLLSGDPREGALLGDRRAERLQPGRGLLVQRRQGTHVVQTVFDEPGSA